MPGAIALVKTDLSAVQVFTPGASAAASLPAAPEPASNAREFRQRASEACRWLASQPATRKRFAAMVLDIDESFCRWVKGASAAAPVLTAALRQQNQEWGDSGYVSFVEPVADIKAGAKASLPFASFFNRKTANTDPEAALEAAEQAEANAAAGEAATVPAHGSVAIALPDSLVRLVLDGLDKQGVKIAAVTSLWHAMASLTDHTHQVDAAEAGPEAVLAVEPGRRVVWAWGHRGKLLAGGAVPLDAQAGAEHSDQITASQRTARRLLLDWLSWAAQLGSVPARARLIGPADHPLVAALVGSLRANAPGAEFVVDNQPDGVQAVAQRMCVQPRPPRASDARQALTRLSSRPNRATRQRYFTAAAALLLIATAIAGLGYRFGQQGRAWSGMVTQVNAESLKTASSMVPAAAAPGSLMTPAGAEAELNTQLAELMARTQPPQLREPNDVAGAMQLALGIIERFEGEVTIERMRFSDPSDTVGTRTNTITLKVPDLRTGLSIFEAFQNEDPDIHWERSNTRQSNTDNRLQIEGSWRR